MRLLCSKGHRPESLVREVGHSSADAEALLRDTEFGSIEELLVALQSSEESMFALYHDAQGRHEEVEKMELENKYLEQQVELKMKRLHELEGNQEQVKQELEKNIQTLKQSISKYDTEYTRNMEVLTSCSDTLLNLLRNVRSFISLDSYFSGIPMSLIYLFSLFYHILTGVGG